MIDGLSNSSGGAKKAYVKILGLKEKNPHFSLYVNQDVTEEFNEVTGTFNRIEFKDITWTQDGKEQGRRVFSIVLINSKGEEIHVQSGFTMLGRNILNSMNSREELGTIKISLYTNKKGYPTSAISLHGDNSVETLEWDLSFDEQIDLTKITELPDGTKNYFRGNLDEVLEAKAMKIKATTTVEQVESIADTKDEEEVNDLPF